MWKKIAPGTTEVALCTVIGGMGAVLLFYMFAALGSNGLDGPFNEAGEVFPAGLVGGFSIGCLILLRRNI